MLELVGAQYSFWDYPIAFLPIIPRAFPFDFSIVPVAYMLLYQYFRTWTFFYFSPDHYGTNICLYMRTLLRVDQTY
ncbi:hypothetical protein RGU12_01870 [Fredinandcohnia sp. QZ13]|uniref:hypothetical protein n=1 Tax=Fredinandcohnia sp. QZ13 TaxID=3073144 RepID=UPI0028530EE7|nr:hypothetical protein [Fredinandcohnia sp. QZ13]MDR4886292.1 hypothetical protein [Fredinandcohnia sp. QZ13]